jgi:hypothetical protein
MTPFNEDKFLLFNQRNVNKNLWSAAASEARYRFQFLTVTQIQSAAEVVALQSVNASARK